MNKYEDNEYPYLRPRAGVIKSSGVPLTSIEYLTAVTQLIIQPIHLLSNPINFIVSAKKSHFNLS